MEQRFPYRSPWLVILGGASLFGCCVAVFGYKALFGERGVIINGLIELGPQGARVFWGVLALLTGWLFVRSGILGFQRLTVSQEIVLAPDWIDVPLNDWTTESIRVDLHRISRVDERTVYHQRFLLVVSETGWCRLLSSRLGKRAYQTLRDAIFARTSAR